MSSRKHYVGAIVVAVAALLVSVPAIYSYSADVTIDTDDEAVDSNWNTVPAIINDGVDTAANYDIVEAWMGNAEDNSTFYFRVNLADSGQLPADYSTIEARLDCNQDGDFTDPEDVVTSWVYHPLGRLTRKTEDDGGLNRQVRQAPS